MAINLTGTFAGASALMLAAVGASADGRIDPRACKRDHLSEETRAFCEAWQQMDARARFKFRVQERLRHTNQPPAADLKLALILPGLVKLDASGSTDEDGFLEHYTFALSDADTGESIAGPVTSREPYGDLDVPGGSLPLRVRASVIVEDDERATDTAELTVQGAQTNCSGQPAFFTCSLSSGVTTCTVASPITEFRTDDLLDAAQGCDTNITKTTTLMITAAGGSGGTGADALGDGGAGGKGGAARMGTTIADLDSTYGSPASGTTYCYGIGAAGGHGDTDSGGGGASTILRTCQNVSQTETTGVLLVGGGGGGGGAASIGDGEAGGAGGIALSTTAASFQGAGATGGGTGGKGGIGGTGGASQQGGNAGANGIGGKGGPASSWGQATWVQGNPQVNDGTGSGGSQESVGGGAGGGGYGGGASGGGGGGFVGGGGGGSYAAKSSIAISTSPDGNSGNGHLQFSFQP